MTDLSPPAPHPAGAMDARSRERVLLLAAVALLAALVYAGALRNGYAMDDETIVRNNPVVHGFGDLRGLLLGPYWQKSGDLYRPVTLVSFALDHALFGGSAVAMHAVNGVLHAVASVLVVTLVLRLGGGRLAAGVAGAVFAVHPVHVEAVANGVGRAEVLSTLAVLLACHLYLRGSPRRIGTIAAVSAMYLLALGAKEIAVTLPALLLVIDGLDGRDERRSVIALFRRNGMMLVALTATLGVFLVLRVQANGTLLGLPPAPYLVGLSSGERMATGFGLLPHVVRLLVWPRSLSSEWGPELIPVIGWSSLNAWLGLAMCVALGAAAVASWRRDRWVAAAVVWVGLSVFPVSSIPFPAGTMLAERNLYLASVGLAFLFPPLVDVVTKQRHAVQLAAAGVMGVLVLAGAVRTIGRVPAWASSDAIFEATARDHPELWWVEWKLAATLSSQGRVAEALPWFARAAQKTRHNGLTVELQYSTALRAAGRLELADAILQHLIDTFSYSVPPYVELAANRIDEGRPAEALPLLDAAARIPRWGPKSIVEIRNVRAYALDAAGRPADALVDRSFTLRTPAVRAAAPPWYHLARLLQMTGDTVHARAALDSAIVRLPPGLRAGMVLDPLPPMDDPRMRGWPAPGSAVRRGPVR